MEGNGWLGFGGRERLGIEGLKEGRAVGTVSEGGEGSGDSVTS